MSGQAIIANGVNSQKYAATAKKTSRTRGGDVKCPHCGEQISAAVEAEIVRRARRKSAVTSGAGRKPDKRPCPKCGDLFGAREIRLHEPTCTGELLFPYQEAVVLSVLESDKGELTRKEIRDASKLGWNVLGSTLQRLEDAKKIICRWDNADETHRQKNRLYRRAPRKGKA
jgi:endogenous inhibitor of DNA gyrase (YacG/DUF329 family)